MTFKMLHDVSDYYSDKLIKHGCTPRGVDWNGIESQHIRFDQLMKVCGTATEFSLGDFGCGYGALLDFLNIGTWKVEYKGFDIAELMLQKARESHKSDNRTMFTSNSSDLAGVTYLVASGVFNVRLNHHDSEWNKYIKETLKEMDNLCTHGFAFNALTSYSDKEKMRDYLYYADPLELFDFCKRNFSKQVALLHDYGLYEFTIIVKKQV